MNTMSQAAGATTYPGRGIIAGKSADGRRAVAAYFIMGRSVNSRNRVFVTDQGGIRTEAFDPSKMEDPSLIIYWPVRETGGHLIVTNGNQTDTIYDFIRNDASFIRALRTRTFEPDAPNFTPRISAMLTFGDGDFALAMGILRAADPEGSACVRAYWEYERLAAGTGRFLHTYRCDGNPIPSFEGDPEPVAVGDGSADEIAREIWDGLDVDNRVSLWVTTRDLETGEADTAIINRNH